MRINCVWESLLSLRIRERLGSFGRIPAVIRWVAPFASIAGLYFAIAAIFGLWPAGDGQPRPTTPTLNTNRPDLPDFLASDVYLCQLRFPEGENSLLPGEPESVRSILSLHFKIINRGSLEFEPNEVFIRAASDRGPDARRPTYLGKESWDYDLVLREQASDDYIDLPLGSTDFGKDHRIVISIDSTGIGSNSQVIEVNESNNDTIVLVDLPQEPPTENWETIPCSPEDAA